MKQFEIEKIIEADYRSIRVLITRLIDRVEILEEKIKELKDNRAKEEFVTE